MPRIVDANGEIIPPNDQMDESRLGVEAITGVSVFSHISLFNNIQVFND